MTYWPPRASVAGSRTKLPYTACWDAEQVLLAGLEEEVLQAPVLEGVVGVEAEAPHVLGDDEEAHAIGRAAAQRHA